MANKKYKIVVKTEYEDDFYVKKPQKNEARWGYFGKWCEHLIWRGFYIESYFWKGNSINCYNVEERILKRRGKTKV